MTEPALAKSGPLAWWRQYWFPQTTPVRLAVLRILLVFLQVADYQRSLDGQLFLVEGNDSFQDPQVIIAAIAAVFGEESFRTVAIITTIWWVSMIAGVFALIGLLTRPAVFLFAVGNWLLVAHDYSYGEKHHPEAIFCIFLMLLAFSPCNRCLSVDSWLRRRRNGERASGWGVRAQLTTAMWPIKTTQWLIAMAYFYAGAAKLLYPTGKQGLPLGEGLSAWLSGTTLRYYLIEDAARHDVPFGLWLAEHPTLCMLAAWGTVVVEMGFPLILIFPRLAPLILLGGLGMHTGIGLTMGFWFTPLMALYVLWIPFEKLPIFRGSSDVSS